MEEKIEFQSLSNFFPKQNQALELTKVFDYLLYGGTLGGGKSRWLRWVPLYWLLRWGAMGLKGVRWGLFCEDYPSLNDRHLTYIPYEFPAWLGKYNQQRHEFTLAPNYGGGVIAFRNLDDPDKYLSVEFAGISVDELNRNPKDTFDKLRRRMRWPGIERTKFVGGCNPIGEAWVRDLWVDRIFPKELDSLKDQFYFLESKPTDNPHLSQAYYDQLATQDEKFVAAALGGDWHAYDSIIDRDGYISILQSGEVSRSIIEEPMHSDIKVLLIDPAGGGDESAITLASEICHEVLFNQPLEDTMALVGLGVKHYKEKGCSMILIDKGFGKPILDRFKELGIPCQGIDFGSKTNEPTRFYDLRAEMYWKQRTWILAGGKLVRNERWNEWTSIKYKIDSDGIIRIEPKDHMRKRGVRSPDVIDSSVLAQAINWPKTKKKINKKRFGTPEFRDNVVEDMWKG